MPEKNEKKRASLISLLFLVLLVVMCSCQANSCTIEPTICYTPPIRLIENLSSAFPALKPEELRKDWAKELVIANNFSLEMDLYRAITAYKRALFLLPSGQRERRMQIEYGILQCYYFGEKYQDVINTYDKSTLTSIPADFPALEDLSIMLEDSYYQIGDAEKACRVLGLIEKTNPCAADHLQLSEEILDAQFCELQERAQECDEMAPLLADFLCGYHMQALSVKKAQTLNAILPGAGYYYVGQKKAALTSFLINGLFIAAAYYFFDQGNIAAGIITTSLETGWYFGGINGAGLAAKEYNERLYSASAKDFMVRNRLFPVLMLKYSF